MNYGQDVRLNKMAIKQQVKQFVRKTLGEPHVGKRSKMRRLERVLPDLALHPHQVLDVGSEDATFVYWMADKWPNAEIRAIDVDEDAVANCLGARPRKYSKRVDFVTQPLAELPESEYDLVTAFDVLEHIQDDVSAVQDMNRTLTPGGTLLVHVPRDRWTHADGRAERVPDEDAWKINAGHVRSGYSPDGLTSLLPTRDSSSTHRMFGCSVGLSEHSFSTTRSNH